MSYRLRIPLELERLQDRLVGTGSADTTPHEFSNNVQRDTKTSVIGHPSHLQLVSIGMGINSEKARVALLERMITPNKIEDAETVFKDGKFIAPAPEKKMQPVVLAKSDPRASERWFVEIPVDRAGESRVGNRVVASNEDENSPAVKTNDMDMSG